MHLAALTDVLYNGWIEDIGTWLLGLIVGALLARRHITRPAQQRHEELLEQHRAHEQRLSALEDKT